MNFKKPIAFLFVFCLPWALCAGEKIQYPPSFRGEQSDTYNGLLVADPYRWLEDSNSEETKKWLQNQEQLFSRYLEGLSQRSNIHKRLASLWNFDFYSTPVRADQTYFFTKIPEGKTASILWKQQVNQTPRIVWNPESSGTDRSIAGFYPSPDGKWIACTVRDGQSRWLEMKVVSDDGILKSDSLRGLHTLGGGIAWSRDAKGFYYVRFEEPIKGDENQALVQYPKIYYHALGTDQTSDLLVHARSDASDWSFTIQTSDDGRYLIVHASKGGSPQNEILYSDLRTSKRELQKLLTDDAAYTYLGNHENAFYIYTNLEAPNGRIISVRLNNPDRQHWNTIIAESSEAIAGGSLVGGNAVGYYGNRFVILYWKDALPLLKVFDEKGKLEKFIELPEGSSIWGGISGNSTDQEVFYTLLTLTRPRTIYKLNLETGEPEIFQNVDKDFRSEDFVTKHIFYESKDGTRVPMFIVHKKGLKLDGKHPLFLYGYGAFGWNSFLWYQPNVLVWLEQGGVYALPRIRGGGEYGESWHQAGTKRNKKNTIDDYITAAEWLIKNRYTSPDRLVANGGSASGFLPAIAVLQRPDLFGAALIDIPFLDLLRYDKYTGGQAFVPEFGSVDNLQEFQFLHSISPYHNVKKQCYPPMMIRVGELDQTAVPMHGYKYVAAVQAAQNCASPVLLHLMRGAGHNFGATPDQNIQTSANSLSFLFDVLPDNSFTSASPSGISICKQKPEHRQFDFWIGEWDVFSGEERVGESSIQQIIESCVIYENYSQKDGYTGKSFNFFDPHLQKWRQTWVDLRGMVSEFQGEAKQSTLLLEGESHYPDGSRALRRMTFTPLGSDRVRQSSEISRDEGKTWKPHYDLTYIRKK